SGVKRGTDAAQWTEPTKVSPVSLEEQISDAGHERAQLMATLREQDRTIADLRRKLTEQQKTVSRLTAGNGNQHGAATTVTASDPAAHESRELTAAQSKLTELQKTIDTLTTQGNEATSRAASLDAKVDELTQLARERERELDQKQGEL